MGKGLAPAVAEEPAAWGNRFCFWLCNESGICRKATLKWVAAVLVSINLLVFALLSLDPFHRQVRNVSPAPAPFQPQVLAKFVLQLPANRLNESVVQLQADLETEIASLNQSIQVFIISVEESGGGGGANSTVTFALVPEGPWQQSRGIDLLRSTLISIFLSESSINLDSPFGRASQFQILKFPGGLTMQPDRSDQLWESPPVVLFNFTLPKNLGDLIKSYEELKKQISSFTLVGSREKLDIKLTNEEGSTVYLPVVVQVSIASAVPGRNVPLIRLEQLAQVVADSPTSKNLGLDMSTFGDVQALNLSCALVQHLRPAPAPSPGPARQRAPPVIPKPLPPPHFPPPKMLPPPAPPVSSPPSPPGAPNLTKPPPSSPRPLPAPAPFQSPSDADYSSSSVITPNPLLLCLILPSVFVAAL